MNRFLLRFFSEIVISEHTLRRYEEATGVVLDEAEAIDKILHGRRVKRPELLGMGFRSNEMGRRERGVYSIYILDTTIEKPVVFVLQFEKDNNGNNPPLISTTALYNRLIIEPKLKIIEEPDGPKPITEKSLFTNGELRFQIIQQISKNSINKAFILADINDYKNPLIGCSESGQWQFRSLDLLNDKVTHVKSACFNKGRIQPTNEANISILDRPAILK